jgi:hypothetical protein
MKLDAEFFRKGITSEDVLAIMGLVPGLEEIGTLAIYEQKNGLYTPEVSFEQKRARALLPIATELYTKITDAPCFPVNPYRSKDKISTVSAMAISPLRAPPQKDQEGYVSFLGSSLSKWADRIVNFEFPSAFPARSWPENGSTLEPRNRTNSVPYPYMVRCIWDMAVTGIKKCDLMVVIENHAMLYHIDYDELFADAILAAADAFTNNHLKINIAPKGNPLITYESLLNKNNVPINNGMIDATSEDAELAMEYQTFSQAIRENESHLYDIRNKLCKKIGDAKGIAGICVWEPQEKIDYEKLFLHLISEGILNEDVLSDSSFLDNFRKRTRAFRFLNES